MLGLRGIKLLVTGAGALLILAGLAPAGASSANISKSYHATTKIENGSLVSLDPQRSGYVQPANTSNSARLLGVALASGDSLLAVDPTAGQVQVATSGSANVIVSTLNGDIKLGDLIAISPFNGVGMKSVPGAQVIGQAQSELNSGTSGTTTQQVKDKDGKASTVRIGLVGVTIGIRKDATNAAGVEINSLQKFVQSLTGRVVSTPRVIISLVVALVALLTLITLIYGAIYGSIISIGRNPLAKFAVFRTLGSVLAMSVLTAVMAGVIIFFLLH